MIAGALFGVLSVLAGRAAADPFWIVQHGPAVVTSRLDPIVSPNAVSGHGEFRFTWIQFHSVVGGSAFSSNYDYDVSRGSKCTTANIFEDFSNYWVPQLYHKEDNGTLSLVRMNRVNTAGTEEVAEFPPGFKMLAGDAKRSTFDENDYTNKAVNYVCLGVDGVPETPGFPEMSCPYDLRAQVFFPNCCAHVAYPVSGGHDQGGPCPATHPKRIMSLFYEFHFSDDYPYQPGRRVWATGDDVGYSLHADFTNGWPVGLFSEAYAAGEACNVGFSIENCPPLNKVFTGDGGGTCQPDDPSILINEEIGLNGPVAQLPGNNPIWSANGAPVASNNTAATSAAVAEPAASSTVATSAAASIDTPATASPSGDPSTAAIATASAAGESGQTELASASTLPSASDVAAPIVDVAVPNEQSSSEASVPITSSRTRTRTWQKPTLTNINLVAEVPSATASVSAGSDGHKACGAKKRRLAAQF
ncbi:hypothetical protein I316_04108 [Kwoniella heveanensis BCC8398]|uniref:DUF1996 domain-containing protein n=1 Tax=Kwoniella heveanensis BCC8398 TaxID=1296120 RepID=A0A1B9GT65_9TREE|nr:hypothetical protein I316_04108 [Kwoniella heveanensis BCC8398]